MAIIAFCLASPRVMSPCFLFLDMYWNNTAIAITALFQSEKRSIRRIIGDSVDDTVRNVLVFLSSGSFSGTSTSTVLEKESSLFHKKDGPVNQFEVIRPLTLSPRDV